ncbi:hypothetical protein [Profundibacterium mesophilum]|uniref:Pyruvate dehydrogenase subunit beta n=1 Tax=Profundibacterium mesophilum KAUST100406-0324 TaxID=1037889 RepID=A0A921NZ31_9RHOB|nr:hypothetical protein [Profundibacterium mesophilum]KAF0677304.1 pyruvate dehydrogenase subunit beta [Profundibacterium mesophilum KAUST100406-0324]
MRHVTVAALCRPTNAAAAAPPSPRLPLWTALALGLVGLAGTPAGAQSTFDGLWSPDAGATCMPDDRDDGSVKVEDGIFYGVGSQCEMTAPVPVRKMDAVLYDMRCSAKGHSWSDRAMFMRAADGGLIMVWNGYAFRYGACTPAAAGPGAGAGDEAKTAARDGPAAAPADGAQAQDRLPRLRPPRRPAEAAARARAAGVGTPQGATAEETASPVPASPKASASSKAAATGAGGGADDAPKARPAPAVIPEEAPDTPTRGTAGNTESEKSRAPAPAVIPERPDDVGAAPDLPARLPEE